MTFWLGAVCLVIPSPTPHCRMPSASRCLSSSSPPSACSACSSQAAVCLRPKAAHWSRSRPSSTRAGCPSGPNRGLPVRGQTTQARPIHWPQITPATRSSSIPAISQSTFPPWDRHFTNSGAPAQAACSALIPQLRPAGGAGGPAPDWAKAVPKDKAVRGPGV